MSVTHKNKLIFAVGALISFIGGCIFGKYIKGHFVLPRILLGSILLTLAIAPDTFGWYGIGYCVRCVMGIVGATIIGKMTNYDLHSLGMLIIGILVYFTSMAPDSFDIVSYHTTFDQNILQICFRLIGSFLVFVGFYNPEK